MQSIVIADDGQWRAIYQDGELLNEGAFYNIYEILNALNLDYKILSVRLQPNGFPHFLRQFGS